ncbi:histidine kinase [soil metagenome]
MSKVLNVTWLKSDVALALGLLAMGLLEALVLAVDGPNWLQVPWTLAWTLPLIWRRRWPVPVLGLVMLIGPTIELVNEQGGVTSYVLPAMLAAYTVGRELDAPTTWWGPALTVGFGWVVFIATGAVLSDYVFIALLYGGAWAVGCVIRRRDLQVGALTRHARELERTYEERKRRAVEQERARIARELHDIVAHGISVISIQAQVVRRRMADQGVEDDAALRSIETTARQAMVDMRRLLQVLRAEDSAPALEPQPSLDQLSDLVAQMESTGIDVEVEVEGNPVSLEPGLGLTGYRVIQESLTNIRKHTDAQSARVVLCYDDGRLEISVEDSGPLRERTDHLASAGGLGLAGMRERVKLYGGMLNAGPKPEGGFRVSVVLPLCPTEVTAS